jgi:hypothetical protein
MDKMTVKDNRVPTSVIRRIIVYPTAKFFETDEKDVYIVRKEEDVEAAKKVNAIWENKEKVLKIFPELKQAVEDAEAKISKPGCSSCGKNAAKRTLVKKMAEEYKKKERDVEPLVGIFNVAEMGMIRNEAAALRQLKSNITRGPRPTCTDCARKHLAQAIVLLGEAHLGYPEHRWLAIGHLAEASDETVADYPDIAEDIRSERLKLMANSGYKPMLMELIERISEIEDGKNTI